MTAGGGDRPGRVCRALDPFSWRSRHLSASSANSSPACSSGAPSAFGWDGPGSLRPLLSA